MAKREVTVVINGEEYVSKAAKDAETGMDGFFGKAKGWTKGFADLKAGWDMVSGAVGRVWSGIQSAIDAYDEQVKSGRVLETSSRLLGVSLDYLNGIVDEGRTKYGLSKTIASEYAVEVAKLEKASGGAGTATQLLSAFLDLGAAKGLSATESLAKVKQSLLGIDEGTDALFGKNPSALWDDFAQVIGRSAGKFSDMDKAAALAFAALQAGDKVAGSMGEYLQSAAGQQAVLNERMREAEASFGSALQPIRLLVLEMGGSLLPIVGPLARILGGTLALAVTTVGKTFNWLYGILGAVATGMGLLTNNSAITKWGSEAVASANRFGESLNNLGELSVRAIKGVDDAQRQSVAEMRVANDRKKEMMADLVTQAKARAGEDAEATKKANAEKEKSWKDLLKSVEATHKMLSGLAVDYKRTLETLGPALRSQLDKQHAEEFGKAWSVIDGNARTLIDRMKANPLPPLVKPATDEVGKMGEKLMDAAGHVLDLGTKFGGLDDETRGVLSNVKDIGSTVKTMMDGGVSFAGVAGILGGVGNIVSTMMQGDRERRELLRKNTEQLERLRREGVRLSESATGSQLADVLGFAGGLSATDMARLQAASLNPMGGGLNAALAQMLSARGLKLSDLDAVAKDLGISYRKESGAVDFGSLLILLNAIKANGTGLSQVGQSFEEQLKFFQDSQRLSGAGGLTQIRDLITFLGNVGGVSAFSGLDLSDPTKLRDSLFGIFTSLNNNSLGAGAMGRLTGTAFRDIITELIGLIDGLPSGAPAPPSGLISVGGVTMPGSVVGDTQAAQAASVAGLLTEGNAFASRTADAVEDSAKSLRSIDAKMDAVLDAISGGIGAIDAGLAQAARMAALEAGVVPAVR